MLQCQGFYGQRVYLLIKKADLFRFFDSKLFGIRYLFFIDTVLSGTDKGQS